MDPVPSVDTDPAQRDYLQAMALFDAPAYVRRARGVEQAYERLLARCRTQRDEWLAMPRLRLATLQALAGDWETLRPFVADVEALKRLFDELSPSLQAPLVATSSAHRLRRAVQEYAASAERFNGRWRAFITDCDLSDLNQLREGYNRYYLLEKSCAMRSDVLARQGFAPLMPLAAVDILAVLPLLPVSGPPPTSAAAAPSPP